MFDHWGSTIYWDALTWEAFAALVAIGAAAVVGWRQVGIQRRQVEVSALAVAEALWERRLEVYDATHGYLSYIATSSAVPGRMTLAATVSAGSVSAPEIAVAFGLAMDRAQFLFRPAVHTDLKKIWDLAQALADASADAGKMYEGPGGPIRAAHTELRAQLMAYWRDVPGIFGDELRLSAHPNRPAAAPL